MGKEKKNDLEKLFKIAKVMRPDVRKVEAGFESRLFTRIREENRKESLLSVWIWRLVPIMAVPLLILLVINAYLKFQDPRDISSAIDAFERAQIQVHLAGE